MARHKHADLIHAWAEGAEIEFQSKFSEKWHLAEPSWHENVTYRIKPKPKLYQSRVEIPKPLTVEEAKAIDGLIYAPAPHDKSLFVAKIEMYEKQILATIGIAYRTPEEAIARAEAMLKVEEE